MSGGHDVRDARHILRQAQVAAFGKESVTLTRGEVDLVQRAIEAQAQEVMRLRGIITKGMKDHALQDEMRHLARENQDLKGG